MTMAEALLIIDVQNDFVAGGALAVPAGAEVITPVNALARDPRFSVVLATRDWHPPDHSSFVSEGGPWPAHCVRDTLGAQLDERLDRDVIDVIIDKGTGRSGPGYSGFENPDLAVVLREHGVDRVTVVGLATDFCVRASALDAVRSGLDVTIVREAVRGIDPQGSAAALAELEAAGAHLV